MQSSYQKCPSTAYIHHPVHLEQYFLYPLGQSPPPPNHFQYPLIQRALPKTLKIGVEHWGCLYNFDIYREKHRLTCCLSTKSSNFLYKSGNNKALLDKNSLTTNSKTG